MAAFKSFAFGQCYSFWFNSTAEQWDTGTKNMSAFTNVAASSAPTQSQDSLARFVFQRLTVSTAFSEISVIFLSGLLSIVREKIY